MAGLKEIVFSEASQICSYCANELTNELGDDEELRRFWLHWPAKRLKLESWWQDLECKLSQSEDEVEISNSDDHSLLEQKQLKSSYRVFLARSSALADAGERITQFLADCTAREKAEDDDCVASANLTAARNRMLGRVSDHPCRLPVDDYRMLEHGTGLRRGVNRATGALIETLRLRDIAVRPAHITVDLQKCSGKGSLLLRSQNLDDEWAAQLGRAMARRWGPACSSRTETLTAIDLSDNRIGPAGARWLAAGLFYLSSGPCGGPRQLRLERNRLGEAGLVALADALTACTNLTHLSLAANPLDLPHLEPGALVPTRSGRASPSRPRGGGASHGHDVDDRTGGSGGGWLRFARAAALAPALCDLDLGGCQLGPDRLAALVGELARAGAAPRLRRLGLSANALGRDGGGHLGRLLALAAAPTPAGGGLRLWNLDAAGNDLGPDGADFLARQAASIGGGGGSSSGGGGNAAAAGLRALSLGSNRLGPRGGAALARALCEGRGAAGAVGARLTGLDLGGCGMDEEAAAALGAAARAAPLGRLRWLVLSQNPLGARGVARLASGGLAGHPRLQALSLAGSVLGCGGAATAGALAATLPALRRLDLSGAGVGDAGAAALARWLCWRHAAAAAVALVTAASSSAAAAAEDSDGSEEEQEVRGEVRRLPAGRRQGWLDELVLDGNPLGDPATAALARLLCGGDGGGGGGGGGGAGGQERSGRRDIKSSGEGDRLLLAIGAAYAALDSAPASAGRAPWFGGDAAVRRLGLRGCALSAGCARKLLEAAEACRDVEELRLHGNEAPGEANDPGGLLEVLRDVERLMDPRRRPSQPCFGPR